MLLAAGVPVWRSTVVRGSKSVHRLLSSFGATRTVSACAHSKRAGVERHAVDARVHGHAAAAAFRGELHGNRQFVAAACALEDFVRRHQVRRFRARGILQLSAGGAFLRRLRRARSIVVALTIARFILIATLTVALRSLTLVRTLSVVISVIV